jgi:hypothetical protein
MTAAEPLDPNQWNVGVSCDRSGKSRPVNLLSTLYVGFSAKDRHSSSKIDVSGLPVDPERAAMLRALVDRILSWKISPSSAGRYAGRLRQFVRWVDESNSLLSRTTIVPLLADYRGPPIRHTAFLRRAAAEGLDLTDDEHKRLFPAEVQNQSEPDDWVVTLDIRDGRRSADFLRLVVPGTAALPALAFAKVRKARQMDAVDDHSDRAELIRALCHEFEARATAKSHKTSTLVVTFINLRCFVVWADDQDLALDKDSVIKTLVLYSQHLTRHWRSGTLSASTVYAKVKLPLHLLTGVLGRQPFEIIFRLSLPPLTRAGLTSARPVTSQLQQFCVNLHAIVLALPSELLCAPIHVPIQVKLWSESETLPHDLPEPCGGYGDQSFDPRLANLTLIKLRIWAEMQRFIAITGCNLTEAQNLTIGEWRTNSRQVLALKARANKFVSVRISKQYERHLESHVAFLEAVWPMPIDADTPLFPGSRFPPNTRGAYATVAGLRAGTIAPRTVLFIPDREVDVRSWAKTNGLRLTSRQLRQAKAMWLLRRYSGDSLLVAKALNNTPQVVHNHYGGKGNLEQAIAEWSMHWASPRSQCALAPGKCESPGRYEQIGDQDQPAGLCNEGACLICRHYRGEETLDYVHSMLSYQYYLGFRAASNSEVARLIDIIDKVVDAYLERNVGQLEPLQRLRAQLSDRPHPRFAALIRLAEIRYASQP